MLVDFVQELSHNSETAPCHLKAIEEIVVLVQGELVNLKKKSLSDENAWSDPEQRPRLVPFEVVLGDAIPVHPHDIPVDVDHGVADDVTGTVAVAGAPAQHVEAALEQEAPDADSEALPVDHCESVQN